MRSPSARRPKPAARALPRTAPGARCGGRSWPPIGVRRLLPAVEFETETQVLRLLDDEDKTVVRLVVEDVRPAGPRRALTPRLRIARLKGYEADARVVAVWLGEDLALEPAARPLLAEALDAAEHPPGGYSSKLDYRLDPAQRADNAAREILLGLLDTLEANIPGTRENLDSEFLHDLRVATRRTRAALAQIPGVLPAAVAADFKDRFAWLQQVTGPVRDLEHLYLLDFDAYQRRAYPRSMRAGPGAVAGLLSLSHYGGGAGPTRRRPGLRPPGRPGPRLAPRLVPNPAPTRGPETGQMPPGPVKDLADERIWRMVRRVRKEGRASARTLRPRTCTSCARAARNCAISWNSFRVSIQGDSIEREPVKLPQGPARQPGRFPDLAVQAAHLRDLAARMQAQSQANTPALLAMGALVADLLRAPGGGLGMPLRAPSRGFQTPRRGRALFRGALPPRGGGLPERPDKPAPGSDKSVIRGLTVRLRIIAVYSIKGGVGKTAAAVNLAYLAAAGGASRTLDLGPGPPGARRPSTCGVKPKVKGGGKSLAQGPRTTWMPW